jgi:hypothetical protein
MRVTSRLLFAIRLSCRARVSPFGQRENFDRTHVGAATVGMDAVAQFPTFILDFRNMRTDGIRR